MKRFMWSIGAAGIVCAAVIGVPLAAGWSLLKPAEVVAADGKNAAEIKQTINAAGLPIGQIVLFSSGVGYFQREGAVEGNARVDLSFPVQDINDLLKSMVVRDLDGGVVSTVSYDSNAPVEKTLKSFALNLNGNPSFGAILEQARGEKVEAVLQQTNATEPGTMTGRIIGIENQRQWENTLAKVQMMEELYEKRLQEPAENELVKELTLRSLRKRINQFKEEMIRFECQLRPVQKDG